MVNLRAIGRILYLKLYLRQSAVLLGQVEYKICTTSMWPIKALPLNQ
jgi:hypothetical protein